MSLWDKAYDITVEGFEKGYAAATGKAGETVWGIDRLHNPPESSDNARAMWAKVDAITSSVGGGAGREKSVAVAVNADPEIKLLAKAIAYNQYWRGKDWEDWGHPFLALLFFDVAFRCGDGGFGLILQRAINDLHGRSRVVVDGKIGKETQRAYAELVEDPKRRDIVNTIKCAFLVRTVHRDAGLKDADKFLDGWTNRTAWWAGQPLDAFGEGRG